jgi:hypothetical protein
VTGHSVVTDLTIAGLEVAVDGTPSAPSARNQACLTIPGLLTPVISEQLPTATGQSGEMSGEMRARCGRDDSDALHLKLLSGKDIVVSSARGGHRLPLRRLTRVGSVE